MKRDRLIEAWLASPPERDELVVHLFWKDEEQWGEIFREDNEYWLEVWSPDGGSPLRFKVSALIDALQRAYTGLRQRLEGS